MSCISETVWMTPSQPSKAARRLARSSRSTCSIVRRSAAPSSAQRCAFLGSSAPRTEIRPPNRARQPGRRTRQPPFLAQERILGDGEGAAARTCAAGGAPDGVPAVEEELDYPRPDEAAGAGDAHGDGHGRAARQPPKQAGGGGGHCVSRTVDPCLFYDVFK